LVESICREGSAWYVYTKWDGVHKSKNTIVEMGGKKETDHIRAHGSGVYTGISAATATSLSS